MITDPLKPFPAALVQPIVILFGAMCAWIVFDTKRALKKLLSLAPTSRLKINPDLPGWIWFYRIDGAVVLMGVIYILAAHWLEH